MPEMDTHDHDEEQKDRSSSFCSVCGRDEKDAGKLIRLPDGRGICEDCIQKSMNMLRDTDLSELTRHIPNLSFINLNDLMSGFAAGAAQEAPEEESAPQVQEMQDIPAPHRIKADLDRYVVGQEHAKKVLSVAVYNHYKRVLAEERRKAASGEGEEPSSRSVEIDKSNILLLGPTGCGKTYLVQTLARLLNVPLAITDATSLTEAGYIGDDIESVVSKLLAAAGNKVSKAEHGIIFVDEIDKIAKKKNTNQRDVSGEAVQQGMLKLLEGAAVEVPVGASSKNAMVPMKTVNTRNILFIVGGAFPGLEEIVRERLNSRSSVGFQADLRDKYDEDKNILQKATVEDLRKFGMIPEFLGRLPVICPLEALTEEMMMRILSEPQNAILRQYEALLAMDEVKLTFEEDALRAIAEKALARDTGARALRSVLEEYMLDIMYEIPKDSSIGEVIITGDYIRRCGGPRILIRGVQRLPGRSAGGM